MGDREILFIKQVLVGTVLLILTMYGISKVTGCAKFKACMKRTVYHDATAKEINACDDISRDPAWEGLK
jgi:hypothetical protein